MRQRPKEKVSVANSLAVALLFGLIKYGMYLSFPLHVAMLVMGFLHRNDCPVNARIPWYLIFGGKYSSVSNNSTGTIIYFGKKSDPYALIRHPTIINFGLFIPLCLIYVTALDT